jgi:hypothetical protein
VLITALQQSREQVAKFFRAEPALMQRSYAPGKWTLRQFLLHLADCESVYIDRARRLIGDEHPLLWNFDENRWASHLFYEQRSLTIAAAQFAANRDALIEMARLTPSDLWRREGVHSERGLVTFEQLLDKTEKHTVHHLEQLDAIVSGTVWQPRVRA